MRPPAFPLRSAFLALPLSRDVLGAFCEIQRRLEPFADCLRFQNPETAHLTLVFWRELLEIEWEPLRRKAREIASCSAVFSLRLEGWGTFGDAGDERVLFLSPVFSPELAALKKRCPWPQAQPFHPHVTLARITHSGRFAHGRKAISKVLDGMHCTMHCDRLRLYAHIDGKPQTPLEDMEFGCFQAASGAEENT